MIDHTGLRVADVARAAKFYDAALGALGLRRVATLAEGADAATPEDIANDAEFATRPDWNVLCHRPGLRPKGKQVGCSSTMA